MVARGALSLRIVGSVLVHNEDLFVEQAIRNVAAFCDRIHVVDHLSSDRTQAVLYALRRGWIEAPEEIKGGGARETENEE